jgi:DNA-directed RNA polymerase subunit RPC12/RpoP
MADFKCGLCGDEFPDEEELEEHIKEAHSKSTEADYECSQCGERFSSKDELFEHIRDAHPS